MLLVVSNAFKRQLFDLVFSSLLNYGVLSIEQILALTLVAD